MNLQQTEVIQYYSQTPTGKNLDPAVNDGKNDLTKQNTFFAKV